MLMEYEEFLITKFLDKKMVVITSMDIKLIELLPRFMSLRNGDAKLIKMPVELFPTHLVML